MSHLDEIFAVYRNRGGLAYGGERISQLEHALQSVYGEIRADQTW